MRIKAILAKAGSLEDLIYGWRGNTKELAPSSSRTAIR